MNYAVIFDCDGVLVDSELVSCTAAVVTMNEYGVTTDLKEIMTLIGVSNRGLFHYFEKRDGISIPMDDLHEKLEANYFRLAEQLQPMPGITELLTQLRQERVPCAVASSGGHHKIEFSLGKTGLRSFFDAICSATEVARGKPEPDLFLYAAQRLGYSPSRCIVVEDSLYGVQAGKRAGMFTMGYPSSFAPEKLVEAGADCVLKDFGEFTESVPTEFKWNHGLLD